MYRTTLFSLSLLILFTLAGCQPADDAATAGDGADLVLLNGKIETVTNGVVEALAAEGGRIVAVGTRDDVEKHIGASTEVIDLGGRLAIPGFIDSHGHFMGVGDARIQLNLRETESWDDVVARVAEAAAQAEPGEWIRGRGWPQDKWTAVPAPNVEGFPIHDSLSAVSPENPVLLTHASGHALFANAKAMELAGVDDATPDPEGGEILRDGNGRATGLFRENAEGLIHRARPAEGTPAEMRKMVELASQECLQKGVTSFHDAGSSFATVDFLKQAADEGFLGVRLWIMIRAPEDELREKLPAYFTRDYADHRLAVGGVKISLDGALGSRGAWLLEPYSDSPESTGLNTASLDMTRRVAELAVEDGYQLCIHAIGDRANREVLDVYEDTFEAHPEKSDLRFRIEHAQHLHPDDIPRFAELGVIAAMQGVHCTSDGPWVPDRLGDKRSEEGAYVWQKLLQSGAKVTNGTDAPVEDVNPLKSFYSTVTRRMTNGELFYPDQKMSRMEALRSYTIDAAYAAFEEDLKGSLDVGKLADVVVLSKDVLTVPDEEILDAKVDYTIVGGKVAYRAE